MGRAGSVHLAKSYKKKTPVVKSAEHIRITDRCSWNVQILWRKEYTVDSRYLEVEGTLSNTSRYPYFDISDVQN